MKGTKFIVDGLKAIITKLEAQEAPAKPNEVKLQKLQDGTEIKVEGDELKEGSAVKVVTSEGEVDIPDDTYILETGESITTVDGKITEVLPKSEDKPTETQMASEEALQALAGKFSVLESKLNTLEQSISTSATKVKESEKTVLAAVKGIVELAEAFGSEPEKKPTETKLSKQTEKENNLDGLVATLKAMEKK